MKKCPKCGTVLDDSKKTCYMCGTVLSNNSPLNFGETFDKQIGATVAKSQDNVFNNVNSINENNNINDIYSNNSNPFNNNDFQNMNSDNLFKDQVNGLNSMQYDERTALEKIFSNDTRFKSKDEMNVIDKNAKASSVKTPTKAKGNNVPANNVPPINTKYSSAYIQQPTIPKNDKKSKNKASVNWGDELKETKKGSKFHISLSFIFNTTCFILFIGIMIFVYFNYIKPKPNENVELGGLVYSIHSDFILKTDDRFSRYYTRGEKCTIRITYENVNDIDGFITRYFDGLTNEYESIEGYTVDTSTTNIMGNTWQELNVSKLQENPSGVGGYSKSTMFKFTAIVYKGTVYDIRYSNLDEDGECSAMYEKFMNTLAFKED